jgi:hypothetical protein
VASKRRELAARAPRHAMPSLKRKPYTPADGAAAAVLAAPNALVYQVRFTGEVFEAYEAYLARLHRYRERVWACTRTGKTGLTYEEALVSEHQHSGSLDGFPPSVHAAILRRVQHSASSPFVTRPHVRSRGRPSVVTGTLELKTLADSTYDWLQTRFIVGEHVEATLDGARSALPVAGAGRPAC